MLSILDLLTRYRCNEYSKHIYPWISCFRFLGTLRDMGNEQHRFFLHAVAMIGGEPLAKVDMEAYM